MMMGEGSGGCGGDDSWACGRPVFYNVCISLSHLSGPVIHDHPPPPSYIPPPQPPVPATPTSHSLHTPPVLSQPTHHLGDQTPIKGGCRPCEDRGEGRRNGSGRTVKSRSTGRPEGMSRDGEDENFKPALHRTVITVSGGQQKGIDESSSPTSTSPDMAASTKKPAQRRYSTVVSLEACGRALCTSRALDPGIINNSSSSTCDEDEGDPELFMLRKISHTSDYSLSSRSDSSLSSPSPPPTISRDNQNAHDSDYFGSSSEDEVGDSDEEEKKSDDEDVRESIRLGLARAEERARMGGVGATNVLRTSRRWRRRAHIKEYDLEQRIALEIKMREGTTKLLAACGAQGPRSNLPHTLEAAKNLLTSNERMTAYMAELQRRRNSSVCLDGSQPSLARVCLSDLRMPLIWKDSDHFKNKGDYRRFAVFVLLKIGTEIYDTVMVNPVDRSMTDICFDDVIVFNGIPSNFGCSIEVYSHVLQNDLSMASTPRKLKRSLHSSISRTVGRKLAASLRDELSNGEMGPKFELVATAKLDLDNVSSSTATYDLTLESIENRTNQLPLYGHFCCRLAAQPDCAVQERIAGYAQVPENENQRSWCRLYGWQLEVWGNKEDVHISPYHPLSLAIDRNTEVSLNGLQVILCNNTGPDRGCLNLILDTHGEASSWMRCLKQHIVDHRQWGQAAEEEMEILTPQPTRHNFILPRRGRFASLYEETPLRDGSPGSEKSSFDDLYSSSAFVNSYCTPAQVQTRPRALTLSSRSSFRRWGSVKCNMPFFKSKS